MVAEAEEFAAKDFGYALSQGSRLSEAEYDGVVSRLAAITTLSEGFVRRSNLRWDYSEFSAELLRNQGLTVGRIDGRFTQKNLRGQASINWDDPSLNAIMAPMRLRSITIFAPSSATRTTCPTKFSPAGCNPGAIKPSRAGRSRWLGI